MILDRFSLSILIDPLTFYGHDVHPLLQSLLPLLLLGKEEEEGIHQNDEDEEGEERRAVLWGRWAALYLHLAASKALVLGLLLPYAFLLVIRVKDYNGAVQCIPRKNIGRPWNIPRNTHKLG